MKVNMVMERITVLERTGTMFYSLLNIQWPVQCLTRGVLFLFNLFNIANLVTQSEKEWFTASPCGQFQTVTNSLDKQLMFSEGRDC